ncbi:hypothetical protein [Tunicatimonas pelagia]|uniref:hypothetical protein n=1 Tax=Tunicatimonas pelagia TaxID=931531 RepID=UPI00266710D6|nr:hypothetical protein [Tunicatimonas pelagia]WKN42370.1 hypothetical protein P0M28_25370 [Tunicatimonas pelagia]
MKDSEKNAVWQKMLDEGQSLPNDGNEPGARAYQLLYEALNKEPDITIPESFAEKVVQRAMTQHSQRDRSIWLLSFILIAVAILGCGFAMFSLYPNFFQLLRSQINILGFAGLMFIIIQVADYWLIQRKQLI